MESSTQPLHRVFGCIQQGGQAQPGVPVVLRETPDGMVIGQGHSDARGRFEIPHERPAGGSQLELVVPGVEPFPIPTSTVHEVEVELPAKGGGEEVVWVGGQWVRAGPLARLREDGPAMLEHALHGILDAESPLTRIRVLLDVLNPALVDDLLRDDCETPVYRWLEALLTHLGEDWVRDWLGAFPGRSTGPITEHVCRPFRILYSTGPDGPDPRASRTLITLPGTTIVLGYTDPLGPPDYIQRTCFWLSHARQRFVMIGSFKDPLGGAEVMVHITTSVSSGAAGSGRMWLNPGLADDEIARFAVHEYMHLIQEEYESLSSPGSWVNGREGGGVLAEEFILPAVNAHVTYANGEKGILSAPDRPLGQHTYQASLLLLYLAEQHPRGGMPFYQRWLEIFGASGYDPAVLPATFQDLWPTPPSHAIRHIGAPWSSEDTLFGNFWLACALKDFGSALSDPRFGFAGNAEFALMERGTRYTRMRPVHVAREWRVRPGKSTSTNVTVMPYGACFTRFEVASSVERVRVEITALGAFVRPLVQVAVVEAGHRVREVVRTTNRVYGESFDSLQTGIRIHHLWVVVVGSESGGEFQLTVGEARSAR